MRHWRFLCLFLTALLPTAPLYAGSPGPYVLAFIDISVPPLNDGQALTATLRKASTLPGRASCFLCEESDQVEMLYLYRLPPGLSVDTLRQAVHGDNAARNQMQQKLAAFEDKDGYKVDGLLIYEHKPDDVRIYAMPAMPGKALHKVSKPVKRYLSLQSLDTLLEDAAAEIPREI
ncbi:FIG00553911: hypothetical protein [Cronobacter condimenti 1330]|uniref:Uncharacterized protein n=1 Tax=Cronobacter condimenti 1330 TaxID=1073999 RepID=K8A036_9ENTR|nr:hypothetical protein [Cronobacter condimenti]ALB63604.1 hypothetical protein AFK62_14345 [Cronobacter condimenti 1330]CCJ72573.1 FIG00553911: hypothetical protein [Cronobacter condimenti 1330]